MRLLYAAKWRKYAKKRQDALFSLTKTSVIGNTPIELYAIDQWRKITIGSARNLFFSNMPVEERVETA